MNLEDLVEAHLVGEHPNVPDDLREEFERAVAGHAWQDELNIAVSIGLHSGEAGVGWIGSAAFRCVLICDIAEGGQILLSAATATLLEEEDLGELSVRDLGELKARRTGDRVRVNQLVFPGPA